MAGRRFCALLTLVGPPPILASCTPQQVAVRLDGMLTVSLPISGPTRSIAVKTYTFQVSLPDYGQVSRTLEMPADFTLEDLHLAIQDAFQFDNAHLYSFFMSGKAWDTATEYALPDDASPLGMEFEDGEEDEAEDDSPVGDELTEDDEDDLAMPELNPDELRGMFEALKADPALMAEAKKQITEQLGVPGFLFDMILNNSDMVLEMAGDLGASDEEDLEVTPPAGDVRETPLDSLGLRKGKSFLYLFDYGDEWRFKVKVTAVNDKADPDVQYPVLLGSVGDSPEQYGAWEDADDDLGDEEEEEEG
jgi:hypothetical protein